MNELTRAGRLRRVRATAYPKLTLSLSVLSLRDDGYHELEALATSISDPHDVLEVEAVPHPGGLTFAIAGEVEHVPPGTDNLAARATEDLLIEAGRSGHGVTMTLRKKIAAGAGLGGGSADAAGALVAVRRLLDIDLDDDELSRIGAGLGSDVPFCLAGGAAWMRGRGEVLEPVTLGAVSFLVAIPPFRLSTSAVYQAWDDLGRRRAARRLQAPSGVAHLLDSLGNDLERAAEVVEPQLRAFREALEQAAGAPALLAGSGSAYVVPIEPVSTRALAGMARRVGRALRVPVVGAGLTTQGVRLSA